MSWTGVVGPLGLGWAGKDRAGAGEDRAGAGWRQEDRGASVVVAGAGAAEGVPGQVGAGGVAVYGHDQVGFGEDAAQDVDDAVGAADSEPVGVGAADGDGGGAQGQGLDHVG